MSRSLEAAGELLLRAGRDAEKTIGNSIIVLARVVSAPIPLNTQDAIQIYGLETPTQRRAREAMENATGEKSKSIFMFRGYIVDADWDQNPHRFVPDPCEMARASGIPGSLAQIMSTVDVCTKVTSEHGYTGKRPKFGDWVNIRLNKIRQPGSNAGSWDTANGELVGMALVSEIQAQTSGEDTCDSLIDLFKRESADPTALPSPPAPANANAPNAHDHDHAEPDAAGPARPAPSPAPITGFAPTHPIIEGAVYRPTNTQHLNGSFASAGLIATAEAGAVRGSKPDVLKDVVEDWNNLARAFNAHFASTTDGSRGSRLGGWGDRSYSTQVRLKAQKPREAAVAGTSNHGWGMAVDTHYYEPDKLVFADARSLSFDSVQYKWLLANAPTYKWHNPPWAQEAGSKPEPWHFESTRVDELLICVGTTTVSSRTGPGKCVGITNQTIQVT